MNEVVGAKNKIGCLRRGPLHVFCLIVEVRKQLSNHLEEDLQLLLNFNQDFQGMDYQAVFQINSD